MALHIIKLAVGAGSCEDLERWVAARSRAGREAGGSGVVHHDTRMEPKRSAELLAGGSLYWVIRGAVQVRQVLLGFETIIDSDGQEMCRMLLDPNPVRTVHAHRRPFQGWRYLEGKDAPPDLGHELASPGSQGLTPQLAAALKDALAW